MTHCAEFSNANGIADREHRQNRFGVVVALVFVDLFIDGAVSRKGDGRAAGRKLTVGLVCVARFGTELYGHCRAK